MKKLLPSLLFCAAAFQATAQISITASDMPVSGDTLRYSFANLVGSGFSAADSGTGKTWNFSSLSPIAQGVDTFKTAASVNVIYGLTISPTAYGFKVADSLPGLGAFLPVTIDQIYNFYNKKSSPSRYVVEGFAARIASIPTPVNYSDEDEWYYFPLNYGNDNSSTFSLSFSLPTLGSIKISGTRRTRVDGWGSIQTPYLTTATNCIRVRTVVDEIDSVLVGTLKLGIPRKTVEYKFLVNGERYPALWVTANVLGTTETIVSIRYRDSKRSLMNVQESAVAYTALSCFPNPNRNGDLHINIPDGWRAYQVAVYDIQGRKIQSSENKNSIATQGLQPGHYLIQVVNASQVGYTNFVKE